MAKKQMLSDYAIGDVIDRISTETKTVTKTAMPKTVDGMAGKNSSLFISQEMDRPPPAGGGVENFSAKTDGEVLPEIKTIAADAAPETSAQSIDYEKNGLFHVFKINGLEYRLGGVKPLF
jgi:hypothetical protein